MSLPNPSEYREPDPLLAFFEEAATPQPAESREPVPRVEPQENAQNPPAPRASDADPELRRRLERAERQIERTLIDITTLKSDLATLVSAVDDIKKRTSRPPARPATVVALPPRKVSGLGAVSAIVILLMAGAALWGLAAVATYDVPEPPSIESETSSAIEPPPPVIVQTAVSTPSPPPARGAPARQPPVVNYVGTLTVDAEPAGDVYLNRKNVGRTPVRLDNLRAGSHLIWIEREGYRRWTRVVPVAADRISRVSASLDPVSR